MKRTGLARATALVLAGCLCVVGCARTPDEAAPPAEVVTIEDGGATDQMWSDTVAGAELYIFPYEDQLITVRDPESIDMPLTEALEDGKFYKVVADVTYLNGGIAGYVNYPQIEHVESCEEVSPDAMDLPSIEEGPYGLSRIGDYADGDLFFYELGIKAVWKDGAWVWSYDDVVTLSDSVVVCRRLGVSEEEIRAGMADGTLSCEDYFVLPTATSDER